MDTTVQETLAQMLDELESSELSVILVPAPDPRHHCHMIRVAANENPRWYQRLCERYPSSSTSATRVKRRAVIEYLRDMAHNGRKPKSEYAEHLLNLARNRIERNPF